MLTAGSPCCIQRDFPICAAAGGGVFKTAGGGAFGWHTESEDGTPGGEIAEGKIICRWSTFQKLQVASLGGETAGGGVFRWLTDPAGGLPCWKNC